LFNDLYYTLETAKLLKFLFMNRVGRDSVGPKLRSSRCKEADYSKSEIPKSMRASLHRLLHGSGRRGCRRL